MQQRVRDRAPDRHVVDARSCVRLQHALAGAYGVAVSGTFIITTVLFLTVGGTGLLVAAIMYTLMRTWQLGSQIIAAKRAREEGSLEGSSTSSTAGRPGGSRLGYGDLPERL